MKKPRNFKASCKFTGEFPGGTKCHFTADVPQAGAVMTAAPLVSSFRAAMTESWPDAAARPRLKRLVITIDFPI